MYANMIFANIWIYFQEIERIDSSSLQAEFTSFLPALLSYTFYNFASQYSCTTKI